jgi:hypothetical protein
MNSNRRRSKSQRRKAGALLDLIISRLDARPVTAEEAVADAAIEVEVELVGGPSDGAIYHVTPRDRISMIGPSHRIDCDAMTEEYVRRPGSDRFYDFEEARFWEMPALREGGGR